MAPALAYPDNHIEISPHLSWVLPALIARHPQALFVHLRRRRSEVVESWHRRGPSLGPGRWARMARMADVEPAFRRVCELNYDVTVANIDAMAGRCRLITLWLHDMPGDWICFWGQAGARGDFTASVAEWSVRYNATDRKGAPA